MCASTSLTFRPIRVGSVAVDAGRDSWPSATTPGAPPGSADWGCLALQNTQSKATLGICLPQATQAFFTVAEYISDFVPAEQICKYDRSSCASATCGPKRSGTWCSVNC